MAAITWTDVTTWPGAEALASLDPSAQSAILAFVNVEWNAGLFGEDSQRLHLKRIFLAAHLATASPSAGSGAAGPVASESVGGASISYATLAPLAGAEGLELTSWGRLCAGIVEPKGRGPYLL